MRSLACIQTGSNDKDIANLSHDPKLISSDWPLRESDPQLRLSAGPAYERAIASALTTGYCTRAFVPLAFYPGTGAVSGIYVL